MDRSHVEYLLKSTYDSNYSIVSSLIYQRTMTKLGQCYALAALREYTSFLLS